LFDNLVALKPLFVISLYVRKRRRR